MNISLDTINIFVALAGAANLMYGFIVWERGKALTANRTFFFFAGTVALWAIAMVFFRSAMDPEEAVFRARLLYVVAALIPLAFAYFSLSFESSGSSTFRRRTLLGIPTLIIVFLALWQEGLISSVLLQKGNEPIIHFAFGYHLLYLLYVGSYAIGVFLLLLVRFMKSSGPARNRLSYILIGTSLPWAVGITTNLLLPLNNIFDFNWMGQISTFFSTSIISYGIFRSRLFDVRIITTELLAFLLWVSAFAQIIVSESVSGVLFNVGVLLLVIILGVLLVRSVYKEIEQRELIEAQRKELEMANERLKELDRLKSEFVSIASHQLRSPLTALKGYASLVLDGTLGAISGGVKDAVQKIFDSSNLMALSVEDFLNVSRIEQGRMKYEFAAVDLHKLVQTAVEELYPTVKNKGLKLDFETDGASGYSAKADVGKLKQVIGNLLDNAIKYTPSGSITVRLFKTENGKKVRVSIKDNGVGIPKETLGKLFDKFVRAKNANHVNTTGTGLGLYVAKQLIEAHRGKIWAESEGEGRGSTFFIELEALV